MGAWRENLERTIEKAKGQIEVAKSTGLQIAALFDEFQIPVPWWWGSMHRITAELNTEEDVKMFPPELLGKLLPLVGSFKRLTAGWSGQVEYTAWTSDGFQIVLRVGSVVCKARHISKKEFKEVEESRYEFDKVCDPLFLDEETEKGKEEGVEVSG